MPSWRCPARSKWYWSVPARPLAETTFALGIWTIPRSQRATSAAVLNVGGPLRVPRHCAARVAPAQKVGPRIFHRLGERFEGLLAEQLFHLREELLLLLPDMALDVRPKQLDLRFEGLVGAVEVQEIHDQTLDFQVLLDGLEEKTFGLFSFTAG